jgi:hypothetical protein
VLISSFGEDQNGEQYLVGLSSGELYRLNLGTPSAATPTATTHDTSGIPRCYVLANALGGHLVGNSNVACGIPGAAVFPPV